MWEGRRRCQEGLGLPDGGLAEGAKRGQEQWERDGDRSQDSWKLGLDDFGPH